jgi:hypothetical protein
MMKSEQSKCVPTLPSDESNAQFKFVAKRMGAKVTEVASSHVPMLSRPDVVIDVIRAAAKAAQGATAAA